MERSVEEWCDVEEDGGGVPLAQSRHAHRQRREQQEQRVGQRQSAQAVAEHLPHLKDRTKIVNKGDEAVLQRL